MTGPRIRRKSSHHRPFGSIATCSALIAAAMIIAPLTACGNLDEIGDRFKDRSTEFSTIQVGASGSDRKAVLAIMGTPRNTHAASFGGYVDAERLMFQDRKLRYEVILVQDKVWFKAAMPLQGDAGAGKGARDA